METYIFRVYYQGREYQGFQRQPSGRGIENFLEMAFIKAGYIESFSSNKYRGSSRTDSGVNALSNIFTLECEVKPNLTYLNSFLPENHSIVIWAFAPINSNFNPRYSAKKHYQYFIPRKNIKKLNNLHRINDYIGTNNFRNFIKKGGAGQHDPITTIYKIDTRQTKHGLIIDIHGNRFGREQIRRMIGFLFQEKYKDKNPEEYFNNQAILNVKSASPYRLTLMRIYFNKEIPWFFDKNMEYVIDKLENQFSYMSKRIHSSKRLQSMFIDMYHSSAPI